MRRRVGIGVDGELHPGLHRAPGMVVVQVQPIGKGVDLQGGPGLERHPNDLFEIDLVRLAPAEHPSGWVEEDVGVGIPHGAADSLGHLVAREMEVGVNGDADDVERRERRVVDVERPVALDVDLGALQDPKAPELAC